jgi:RHS repeat-associated protein
MPGRTYTAQTGYRYGFNGKENDNEIKGEGNQQDYGMRIYDPRLGRFLSVDPIEDDYPFYSPYHFAGNTPIRAIDLDGLEPAYFYYNNQFNKWVNMPAGDNLPRRNIPEEEGRAIPVGSGPNDGGRGVSMLFNALPVIGEIKMVYESGSGEDFFTGEKISTSDRILGVVPYVRPVKTIAKVEKATNVAIKTEKLVAKSEKAAQNTEKAIVAETKTAVDATKTRVKLRKETIQKIEAKQPRNVEGKMIDPNTKQPLIEGQVDIGHTPGNEWKKRKEIHQKQGSNRKEVIEAENNPNLYHLEDRSSNRSHKFEKKGKS